MTGLDNHGNALRIEMVLDALRDLGSQAFLDLQAARICLEHTGKLGNANHAVARHIGNRCLADDRSHMVFAMRLERNVLEQHQFIIAANFGEPAR